MKEEQYLKNISVPEGPVDVILDTDTYNEIDDQFAIAYMLGAQEKLRIKGFCAAPFVNEKADTPKEGMEKSYDEILKLLSLAHADEWKANVYKGSERYLSDETTPVESPAASFMARMADSYTPEHPLYIVAIGAITNVASAILMNPDMIENTVIIWLGGHGHHMPDNEEFNLKQDVAAGRVIFGCGVPLVQLPCFGVVDQLRTTKPELEYWLKGKNELSEYLMENTIREAESYAAGKPWSRVIWDVAAVAWLLNEKQHLMKSSICASPIPEYAHCYSFDEKRHKICYVYQVDRDAIFEDLFDKLSTF